MIHVCLLVALCGFSQGNQQLRDSLAAAIDLLEYHPDSVDLRLKKAAWNVELEQWQYAKEDYDRVLRQHPDNIAALYYRAFVNEKLGRYNFARLDYQNLMRLVPATSRYNWVMPCLTRKTIIIPRRWTR